MLGCLLERELINDFLHRYPSSQWCQIIPALTQLGIIHLYENYNPNIEIADLNDLVEHLLRENFHKSNKVQERGRKMSNRQTVKLSWKEQLRKPSSEWCQEDDELFDRSLSKFRSYSSDSSNTVLYR